VPLRSVVLLVMPRAAAAERNWPSCTHAEVCRFFDGLELLEPGVVQLHQWRPAGELVPPRAVSSHGGVGRKT
jgi:S-adenosyl methyltransferase